MQVHVTIAVAVKGALGPRDFGDTEPAVRVARLTRRPDEGWRFVERRLMLRGNGPESLSRKRQGQGWLHEAGKWARFTAREVVFA